MNIQSISLHQASVQFKSSHDHSKWAVAADGKKKASWVCIGDINRAVCWEFNFENVKEISFNLLILYQFLGHTIRKRWRYSLFEFTRSMEKLQRFS